MVLLAEWETVPFHFIWVSLTLLYGFRVWRMRPTLLLLASAEHPGFVHRTPIEIEPLLVDAIRRWGHVERRWGISVVDVTVDADHDRLALALDTLIEDAVKHTSDEDSIELSVRREGQTAVVTVEDTGTGIAAEDP